MLTIFFMICAVVGGAFVLAQVLLSMLALGAGHGVHLHHGHGGAGRGGGGRMTPRGTGFRAAHAPRGAPAARLAHSAPQGAIRSAPNGAAQRAVAQVRSHPHLGDVHGHWAAAWFHGLFNFQGIMSGAAVLGLAGLAATAGHLSAAPSLAIAMAAALVMMAMISALFSVMAGMEDDGTVRLEEAVGQVGTVYLGIPGNNEGLGKISLTLRQQVMEFPAATAQSVPLATGQKVIVIALRQPSVMEVVSAEKFLRDLEA